MGVLSEKDDFLAWIVGIILGILSVIFVGAFLDYILTLLFSFATFVIIAYYFEQWSILPHLEYSTIFFISCIPVIALGFCKKFYISKKLRRFVIYNSIFKFLGGCFMAFFIAVFIREYVPQIFKIKIMFDALIVIIGAYIGIKMLKHVILKEYNLKVETKEILNIIKSKDVAEEYEEFIYKAKQAEYRRQQIYNRMYDNENF